jgi:hypothetical protein
LEGSDPSNATRILLKRGSNIHIIQRNVIHLNLIIKVP